MTRESDLHGTASWVFAKGANSAVTSPWRLLRDSMSDVPPLWMVSSFVGRFRFFNSGHWGSVDVDVKL